MKHEQTLTPVPVETETNTPASCGFRCPNCEMAALFCGECSQFTSEGKCEKYGHYTTADHWACPWARY